MPRTFQITLLLFSSVQTAKVVINMRQSAMGELPTSLILSQSCSNGTQVYIKNPSSV